MRPCFPHCVAQLLGSDPNSYNKLPDSAYMNLLLWYLFNEPQPAAQLNLFYCFALFLVVLNFKLLLQV